MYNVKINRKCNSEYEVQYHYKTKNELNQTIELIFYETNNLGNFKWTIYFEIKTKRKHPPKLNEQTGKDGIKSLIWAKNCIKDFIVYISSRSFYDSVERTLYIYYTNQSRKIVYERGLSDIGFKHNDNYFYLKF